MKNESTFVVGTFYLFVSYPVLLSVHKGRVFTKLSQGVKEV